jgi:hypothetical protein
MKGYVVFVASRELKREEGATDNTMQHSKQDWIFVDVEETKENYAIPSAFSKYAEYLNLVLGKNVFEKKE